jgi:WD40 repeat protein
MARTIAVFVALNLAATGPAVPPSPPVPPVESPDPEPQIGDQGYAVEYSPNGKLLAVVHPGSRIKHTDHRVVLFDTATWKPVHTLTGSTEELRTIIFSADGGTLFGGGFDRSIYSWDTRTGILGRTLDAKAGMCCKLVMSPDGNFLVSGHHDVKKRPGVSQIRIWDPKTFKTITTIKDDDHLSTYVLTFTPDGKAIATNCGKWDAGPKEFFGIAEFDVTTGKERKRFDAVRVTQGAHPIICQIVFSPDGKRMYVGGGEAVPVNGNAKVTSLHAYLWAFEYPSGKLLKTIIEDRDDYVRQVAVSPDGKQVFATCGSGPKNVAFPNGAIGQKLFGELHGFETEMWKSLWKIETDSHHHWSVRSSPGGKRVLVSDDEGVYMLDAKTGERKGALLTVLSDR